MIEPSQQSAKQHTGRAPARTAMVVLFAFALNLIGINGAFAALPGLFSGSSTAGVQTQQSGLMAQSRHINIKPCHHNRTSNGHRTSVAQTGNDTNNGLCCTEDSQAEAMPTVMRTKRDREWQATNDEFGKAPLLSLTVIDTSASPHIELHQQPTAQIAGLLGAQAQFLRTVRLLT